MNILSKNFQSVRERSAIHSAYPEHPGHGNSKQSKRDASRRNLFKAVSGKILRCKQQRRKEPAVGFFAPFFFFFPACDRFFRLCAPIKKVGFHSCSHPKIIAFIKSHRNHSRKHPVSTCKVQPGSGVKGIPPYVSNHLRQGQYRKPPIVLQAR